MREKQHFYIGLARRWSACSRTGKPGPIQRTFGPPEARWRPARSAEPQTSARVRAVQLHHVYARIFQVFAEFAAEQVGVACAQGLDQGVM